MNAITIKDGTQIHGCKRLLSGMHPMIEKYPLNRVAEAYEQMHSGKARFRAVLTM